MQLAFTKRNSFMLTTDGRVFSWGENTPCLGLGNKNNLAGGNKNNLDAASSAASSAHNEGMNDDEDNRLNEIIFTNPRGKALIVMIATGISHCLALDTAGNVHSWGSNNSGQLGIGNDRAGIGGKNAKGAQMSTTKSRIGASQIDEAGDDVEGGYLDKPEIVGGEIKDYEICQIFAGKKQSFAVTRTGKIFAWGCN